MLCVRQTQRQTQQFVTGSHDATGLVPEPGEEQMLKLTFKGCLYS